MSLVITSGTVEGGDNIVRLKNIAVGEAIIDALTEMVMEMGAFGKTIARKTGDMRSIVRAGIRALIAGRGRKIHSAGKTVITWDEIMAAILGQDDTKQQYVQYHFSSRGFYVKPTTRGTFPMRASRFFPIARKSINRKIPFKLKQFGISSKVEFSV